MQIYDRIRQDHEKARTLFDRLKKLDDAEKVKRKELFDDLKRELWSHAKIEEAVFYAVLQKQRETRGESLEAFNEHHIINSLLEELDAMPISSDTWNAKLGVLQEVTEHHMEEEEEEVFEEARGVLSDAEAEAMGRAMDERKAKALDALAPYASP